MSLLKLLRPKNQLEEGGRSFVALHRDEGEPEKICPACRKNIPLSRLWENQMTCPCGYHFRIKARQRIHYLVDEGSFKELFEEVQSKNILDFPGYTEKLSNVRTISEENEAVICGTAKINGLQCCLFVMEPFFMMGSMGSSVGEKITRLFEHALKHRLPVIGITVSGGARMQEGLISLMQMAKTCFALKRHSDAGLFYLAVLTDPTTGGVTASFAMGADIIIAEPGATIGFAGARVIEQTTKKALPKGFQKSEFLLEHGFIDRIVPRIHMKQQIYQLLLLHSRR